MKGEEAYLANVLNTMRPMPALSVHNAAATAACKHWQAPIDVMAVVAGIIMVELTYIIPAFCLLVIPCCCHCRVRGCYAPCMVLLYNGCCIGLFGRSLYHVCP
jgi:hypothetical protein